MITLNHVYNVGASIIGSAGSLTCNVTGVKDLTEAVNHYRNGEIQEAKQSGFKVARRLICVATLITGVYLTGVYWTQNPSDAQIIKCFKAQEPGALDYWIEKGFIPFVREKLMDGADMTTINERLSAYYCETVGHQPCDPYFFLLDFTRVLNACIPSIFRN